MDTAVSLVEAVLFSSFGRAFLFLPLLWNYHPLFLPLVHIFVFTSHIVAIRVLVDNYWSTATGIVLASILVSLAIQAHLALFFEVQGLPLM